MKEVTYKDWAKNPTPRMMWVWNKEDSSDKVERKVVYILDVEPYYFPVMTVNKNNSHISTYKYCAEIEETKMRRMTHQELAWWLREKPTREYKYKYGSLVSFDYSYMGEKADNSVNADILIREDGGEWREPLIEVNE